MPLEAFERRLVELFGRQALAFYIREEMSDQVRNILGALAQGRQAKRNDIQAEEQILAEQAVLFELPEILVGRGDNADVGLDRRAAANGRVFALLQHPQQSRLRFHRHVADFVEKQRATFSLLETAGAPRIGAGEGALLMAEQFGFNEIAGIAAMLMATKGPVRRLP